MNSGLKLERETRNNQKVGIYLHNAIKCIDKVSLTPEMAREEGLKNEAGIKRRDGEKSIYTSISPYLLICMNKGGEAASGSSWRSSSKRR